MCIHDPLVSVIVPVYNAQKTIERCLDSVLSQTFKDLELIVVDDGSTDNTRNILAHYATMNTRLIIITQENSGVSVARNTGMERAIGKWITFVDADDYLELNCLEAVFLNNDIDKYDLIFWNYYMVKPYKKEAPVIFHQPKGEYGINELLPYVFYNNGKQCLSTVFCRLFKREIILNYQLYFPQGIVMYEDKLFMIDYLLCTEQILGLTKHLYNRTLNAESAMHCWHYNAKGEYLLAANLLKEKLVYNGIWNMCQKAFNIWILQENITQYLETHVCHVQNTDNKKTRKKELYLFINEDLIKESLKQIKYSDLPIKSIIKFLAVKHGWIKILDKWYRNKEYFM